MDTCHLNNAELEPKHQKYRGRVVLQGDISQDDPGACEVFTEQGSSASQMTVAKVMANGGRLSSLLCRPANTKWQLAVCTWSMESMLWRFWSQRTVRSIKRAQSKPGFFNRFSKNLNWACIQWQMANFVFILISPRVIPKSFCSGEGTTRSRLPDALFIVIVLVDDESLNRRRIVQSCRSRRFSSWPPYLAWRFSGDCSRTRFLLDQCQNCRPWWSIWFCQEWFGWK